MVGSDACGATIVSDACGATIVSDACGATIVGDACGLRQSGDLGEGDLQFVERVRPPLVHPGRLRCGSDEPSGEQV